MYIRINNKQYTLDLWDTTGQEDYDRLRPLSYIESDVSLVCATLGIHEEYKSARDKWAPELKHFCAGNPIILLGIKNPDGDGEAEPGKITELGDDLEYGRDIAKEIGAIMYLECDLLTGKGLKETFDQVCHGASNPR
jgi:small GTP-binding protein